MSDGRNLPEPLARGAPARLFPVLADTSREGRSLSVLLACLRSVDAFGEALFAAIGQRVGKRGAIEAYTEVVLREGDGTKSYRPDGLLLLRKSSQTWAALIEAKVGKNELDAEQVETYLRVARANGVDALITISNQFAALPTHHPVAVAGSLTKKVEMFHWSWTYILTEAKLLLDNEEIEDPLQRWLLAEFVRFLSHESAGVRRFDQMPAVWPDVVAQVQAGGALKPTSHEVGEVVGAWHQEVRDLSLVLSRQLGRNVTIRTKRAHVADPSLRLRDDSQALCADHDLTTCLSIPDAAAQIDVEADLQRRSLSVSMKIKAPEDRKGTKARVNWLVRQLPSTELDGFHLRAFWPGRAAATLQPLAAVGADPDLIAAGKPDMVATSFELLLVRDIGARFGSRKRFIAELETAVPEFYNVVGQYVRAWQPRPPRLRDESVSPKTVDTEAIQQAADEVGSALDLLSEVWRDSDTS